MPHLPMLTYLAVPYSHPDPSIRVERFEKVNMLAAKLMQSGYLVFSPISQSHPIAEAGKLPTNWEYWEAYDRAILSACSALLVYALPGWRESKGVAGEIAIAAELGIPVRYVDDDGHEYFSPPFKTI